MSAKASAVAVDAIRIHAPCWWREDRNNPDNYLQFRPYHICRSWYDIYINIGVYQSVLILRFLPILLVFVIAVLLARCTGSQKEPVETNAADMTPLLIALSGLIGLFVLFVSVAEFITRM